MSSRVRFVITDLKIGGTPRVVKALAIRLRPLGFNTAVVCLAPWGPVADELTAAGVPVTAIGVTRSAQLPAAVRAVRRATADADVVFSFLVHANVIAALAGIGRRTPLLQSIQTTQPYPAWHWWAQGLAGARAARLIVPSASVADVAAAWSGLPRERIDVIPNAVEMPVLTRSDRIAGPWRVGFVGRLDPVKRVTDLVEAVARLPAVVLHVYGDGPDRANVEAAVARLGLRDRVRLHGTVPSSADALATIDTLVLPSEAEGFGLVLVEAMAAGVPVVATDVAGIRDVVQDGMNGLLVPVRRPDFIAEAIGRVHEDSVMRKQLIAGGRTAVRTSYEWDAVLSQYVRVLKQLDVRPSP